MLESIRKWVKKTENTGYTTESSNAVSMADDKNVKDAVNPHTGFEAPPSRWVQGNFAPHGFADDDGAMKQVESPVWRNMYQAEPEPFMNLKGQVTKSPILRTNRQMGERKSVLLLQTLTAGLVVAGFVYVSHSDKPLAKEVNHVARNVFAADYSSRIVPEIDKVFNEFHISAPTFGVHAAVYMHTPLAGNIEADYSGAHPEIWIQGGPDAPVLAAGSGIVTKVDTTKGSTLIEIDHGAIGQSIYAGVASISVHVHEYVDSGQVIGRLPNGGAKQELRFAMVKNGQFENPHDFIHFDSIGQ